jgi:eukaryotic-like serine/threonine-protein kinase
VLEDSSESDHCGDHADVVAGRYQLGPVLRRSASCCAHRAYDELLQRTVRVTLVESGPAEQESFSLRPQGWRARDPEVAELFDAGADHDRLFLVTHHPDEPTLAETTPPGGLDLGQLRDLGTAVATALLPRHQRGAAHGGLGAGTVAFTAQGTSLAEFGLLPWLARWGDVPVTPPYAAPEQLTAADFGPAGDVYALGRLLGELGPDHGLRPGLRTLLAEMTAEDPWDRPSMAEVRRRLSGRACRGPSTRTGKRRLALAGAACCLVGLGVGLSALAGEAPAVGSDGATLAATAAVPVPVIPLGPLLPPAPADDVVSARTASGATPATASQRRSTTAEATPDASPRVVDVADPSSTGSHDQGGSDTGERPSRTTAPATNHDQDATSAPTRAGRTSNRSGDGATRDPGRSILTQIGSSLGRSGDGGVGRPGSHGSTSTDAHGADPQDKATSHTLPSVGLPESTSESS